MKQVDVVYFDLSSAFNKVAVTVVLKALECHGVVGSLLEWFRAFLLNRRQYVIVREEKSGFFMAPSGVPQGGHSSQTLSNLVMNLFCYMSKECKVSFYSDDSKFAMAIRSPSDCIILSEGVNCLCNGAMIWAL